MNMRKVISSSKPGLVLISTLICFNLIVQVLCSPTTKEAISSTQKPKPPPECLKCDKAKCVYPKGCKHGLVPDKCDCCPTCGLEPGARCGGPNNSWGYCGQNMVCFFSGQEAIDKKEGYCLRKE